MCIRDSLSSSPPPHPPHPLLPPLLLLLRTHRRRSKATSMARCAQPSGTGIPYDAMQYLVLAYRMMLCNISY
eukprot:3346185-Rhodomonas_salina.1